MPLKRRCICPSCDQKRAPLFAKHVDMEILGQVPIRQYVVTVPRMPRLCFKYDRKLLGELSRCFYYSNQELCLLRPKRELTPRGSRCFQR
jgi:hypothetical protein